MSKEPLKITLEFYNKEISTQVDHSDLTFEELHELWLEIVRAMCIEPKLLCLDEPAAGLNPKESSELNKLLEFIKNDKKFI